MGTHANASILFESRFFELWARVQNQNDRVPLRVPSRQSCSSGGPGYSTDFIEWTKRDGVNRVVLAWDFRSRSGPWKHRQTFRNTGRQTLHELNSQTCFHLVNAPQFISLQGSRIWANLDGHWMTTDKVERDQSPDPRRVTFLKRGLRTERTVVPSKGFPSAIMPEAAHHPLFIAENFEGKACVGIVSRNFEQLFNNNDVILRCLHSESVAIRQLEPGETARQDSVIIFYNGDHSAILDHYTTRIATNWPPN